MITRVYSPEQTCPHLQSLTQQACIHAWWDRFTGQPNNLDEKQGRNKKYYEKHEHVSKQENHLLLLKTERECLEGFLLKKNRDPTHS